MRQRYWKPQHEVFVSCMLQHEDPTKAYRTAYPKASAASARVGGYRLYNYPHIRQRIQPIIAERRAGLHKIRLERGAERERLQNERRMEMRGVLYNVVMRKLKRKRNFTVKGQTITIEDNPSVNTVLNAMVLDLRLEAGYNNWPVIEARFARIMASLLPREKRVTTVINSNPNPIQATVPARSPDATLLQKITTIKAVISNEERNLLKCGDVADPETSGDFSLCSTALRSDRNDALMGLNEQRNVAVLKRVQTVTISRTNPAQTHPVRVLKKARITRAVTKTIWPKLKETG